MEGSWKAHGRFTEGPWSLWATRTMSAGSSVCRDSSECWLFTFTPLATTELRSAESPSKAEGGGGCAARAGKKRPLRCMHMGDHVAIVWRSREMAIITCAARAGKKRPLAPRSVSAPTPPMVEAIVYAESSEIIESVSEHATYVWKGPDACTGYIGEL